MKSIFLRNFIATALLVFISFLIIAVAFVGIGRSYHSARFWQYVAAVIPDHRERRRWLREHGAELMARVY